MYIYRERDIDTGWFVLRKTRRLAKYCGVLFVCVDRKCREKIETRRTSLTLKRKKRELAGYVLRH